MMNKQDSQSYIEYNGKEVTIMACSDCNTKCEHCYIGYSGNFSEKQLYDLCFNLIKKYKVDINGTELLMHPEYFESMHMVNQDVIITNGLELFKNLDLIRRIKDIGIKYVGISDHFFIHTDISKVDANIVEPLLNQISAKGLKTDIRVTVTCRNYDKVEEMCSMAYDMGADGIKFTNYMQPGDFCGLDKGNILSEKQINCFFEQLEEVRKKYDKSRFVIRRCGSFGSRKNSNFSCTASSDSVVITPNLNVYPCIFLARDGYEIGKVQDNKIFVTKESQVKHTDCIAKKYLNRI